MPPAGMPPPMPSPPTPAIEVSITTGMVLLWARVATGASGVFTVFGSEGRVLFLPRALASLSTTRETTLMSPGDTKSRLNS